MSASSHFFIAQEIKKAESSASAQIPRVLAAKSVDEVIRISATVSAYAKPMAHSISSLKRLKIIKATKVAELVSEALSEMETLLDSPEFEKAQAQTKRDIDRLRGHFPREFSQANRRYLEIMQKSGRLY